jgi:hypothetical protein
MGKLSSACENPKDKNVAYPYGAMSIHSRVGNLFPNNQQLYEWHCNLKGLSQHGGWADFYKNLRASLFNDDLSNEPYFGQIHLAGQYLLILWLICSTFSVTAEFPGFIVSDF